MHMQHQDFDPILQLYSDWCAAEAELKRIANLSGDGRMETPEAEAAIERESSAFEDLIKMTPTSVSGLAALAHALWSVEGPGAPEDTPLFVEQASQPGPQLIAAIWRSATGKNGFPRAA